MKLIILERDVLIAPDGVAAIRAPDEWKPIAGSFEAIARLHREGYRLIVITTQPDVGAGHIKIETLNRIHARMLEAIRPKGGEIDAIFICPHALEDRCRCHRPQPGLFEEVAERLKINLNSVFALGTQKADIQAAQAVGATPVWIGETQKREYQTDIPSYPNLASFAEALSSGQLVAR